MEYYLISNSANKKEVGHYIQTIGSEIPNDEGEFEKNSRANLTEECFPDFLPNLNFELDKKAKLTDVVSASDIMAKGLLINERTKMLISELNFMNSKYYNASLKYNNEVLPYYWLHTVNRSFDGIDFLKSIFCVSDFAGNKITNINIGSLDDYLEKINLLVGMDCIRIEKMVFTSDFENKQLDLFFFPFLHKCMIASRKLIQIIIENNVSGLEFENAKFI